MKLVCFHLFNDYSGSPKVLKMLLQELLVRGYNVALITSKGGVLDELQFKNLKKTSYHYLYSANPATTLLRYSAIQIYTFFLAFRYLFTKDTAFYINTLLPVGPALAGRLMGKRVIYHYHENAANKGTLYKILCKCMEHIASEIICVSQYQRSYLQRTSKVHVVPNALPQEFVNRLHPDIEQAFRRKTVLMLSSLKLYKGTLEFIKLAQILPQYKFHLVINNTQENINHFISQHNIASTNNLTIYPQQKNVIPFYTSASILLNLSDKNQFVETFGLTALEAMTTGLPVIVPTIGGIAEMVEDGINGYKIDVQQLNTIATHIHKILSDELLYHQLSNNALKHSRQFNANTMTNSIISIISNND